MSKKENEVPVSQIPEVQHVLEVKARIDRLLESYPEVFEQLADLRQEYNAALEAADKTVRARKVSCGPFELYQWSTKYDADKLYEELGREGFLKVGGSIKTVTVYEVDKNRLEAHITSGSIPEAVVSVVKEVTPRYKKPDKIVL